MVWIGRVNRALWSVLCAVLFFFIFFIAIQLRPMPSKKRAVFSPEKRRDEHLPNPPFSCQGPFSLASQIDPFYLIDLKQGIYFLGTNERPDVGEGGGPQILVFDRTGTCSKTLSGKPIYLSCDRNMFSIEKEPTTLRIIPHLEGTKILKCRSEIEKNFALIEKQKEFSLSAHSGKETTLPLSPSFQEVISFLSQAEWQGNDLLFSYYPSLNPPPLDAQEGRRGKIRNSHHQEPYGVYIQQGKYYVWDQGELRPTILGKSSQCFPLVYVRSVSSEVIDWIIWDELGVHREEISQRKTSPAPFKADFHQLFSYVTQRTHSQLFCRIQNRSFFLKKGDWLLYAQIGNQMGWKKLKSSKEREEVIDFAEQGDLFVLDEIIRGASPALQGTLFNSSRTQAKKVCLPFYSKSTSISHLKNRRKRIKVTSP